MCGRSSSSVGWVRGTLVCDNSLFALPSRYTPEAVRSFIKTMAPTALCIKPWCWPSHRQVAGCRSNNSKVPKLGKKRKEKAKKKPSGKE